jgi:hypothetical protein
MPRLYNKELGNCCAWQQHLSPSDWLETKRTDKLIGCKTKSTRLPNDSALSMSGDWEKLFVGICLYNFVILLTELFNCGTASDQYQYGTVPVLFSVNARIRIYLSLYYSPPPTERNGSDFKENSVFHIPIYVILNRIQHSDEIRNHFRT